MSEFLQSPLFCYLFGVAVGAFCQYSAPLEKLADDIKHVWSFYRRH